VYILDPTKTRKVDQKYVGPYYIVERIRDTASYRLRNSENVILDRTVPRDQIKVVPNDENEQDGVSVETAEYEVEQILDHEVEADGSKTYCIKWKGYPIEEGTWEPESYINDADVIKRYWDIVDDVNHVRGNGAVAKRKRQKREKEAALIKEYRKLLAEQ
jgi:hypothetical protein